MKLAKLFKNIVNHFRRYPKLTKEAKEYFDEEQEKAFCKKYKVPYLKKGDIMLDNGYEPYETKLLEEFRKMKKELRWLSKVSKVELEMYGKIDDDLYEMHVPQTIILETLLWFNKDFIKINHKFVIERSTGIEETVSFETNKYHRLSIPTKGFLMLCVYMLYHLEKHNYMEKNLYCDLDMFTMIDLITNIKIDSNILGHLVILRQ